MAFSSHVPSSAVGILLFPSCGMFPGMNLPKQGLELQKGLDTRNPKHLGG